MDSSDSQEIKARQAWLAILAQAGASELEAAWEQISPKPDYSFLRRPETGLIMVRGRAGGTGRPFNLGEMTLTRCAVKLSGGAVGLSYLAGRDKRRAELAAVFDALLQDPARRPELEKKLIAPLAQAQAERLEEQATQAAATRVDFLTMVRGD